LREGKAKYKAFFVLKHAQLARSRDERIALRAVEIGLKCHAGWVERTAHELSGPDGLPLGEPKPLNFVAVTDALFQAIRNDPVVQDRVRWNLLRLLMPGATDAELWSTWKVLCRRREEIEAVRAHAGPRWSHVAAIRCRPYGLWAGRAPRAAPAA
jgi:hypothetical protein